MFHPDSDMAGLNHDKLIWAGLAQCELFIMNLRLHLKQTIHRSAENFSVILVLKTAWLSSDAMLNLSAVLCVLFIILDNIAQTAGQYKWKELIIHWIAELICFALSII